MTRSLQRSLQLFYSSNRVKLCQLLLKKWQLALNLNHRFRSHFCWIHAAACSPKLALINFKCPRCKFEWNSLTTRISIFLIAWKCYRLTCTQFHRKSAHSTHKCKSFQMKSNHNTKYNHSSHAQNYSPPRKQQRHTLHAKSSSMWEFHQIKNDEHLQEYLSVLLIP